MSSNNIINNNDDNNSIMSEIRFPTLIKYTKISDLNLKFILLLILLSITILYFPIIAWSIQRFFNFFREICSCDLIYFVRKFDFVESIMLLINYNKHIDLKYFICRSLCPY